MKTTKLPHTKVSYRGIICTESLYFRKRLKAQNQNAVIGLWHAHTHSFSQKTFAKIEKFPYVNNTWIRRIRSLLLNII